MSPVITFWRALTDPRGEEWRPDSWQAALAGLLQPSRLEWGAEQPGWSPARFSPCQRAANNVREVFALCLDFDGGQSFEWALDKFARFAGLVHTTRRHTPEAHRFRVVLPLSRSVNPAEYAAIWRAVAGWCGSVDPATKDPGRFWFLPAGEFRHAPLGKVPLDVDEWLKRDRPTKSHALERVADPTDIERRAIRYIAKMPEAIAGQHGHDACWQVACALACGFDLSEHATLRILAQEYNPRCTPAWSEKELRHKAQQARAASLPRGYLLRESRDWTPDQRVPAPFAPVIQIAPAPKPVHERFQLFTERQLLKQVFDDVTSKRPARGFTTGISDLDHLIGGLRLGMVTCVGAQTSWGKSTLATMILDENLPHGVKCLIVSNEDQPLIYGRRIACRRGELNALRVRDGDVSDRDIMRLAAIGSAAKQDYVLLNAIGMRADAIVEAILACREELGTELVLVDYLQRIRMSKSIQDRRNEVSQVAEQIGDAIKKSAPGTKLENPASGVVFSQLKRIQDRPPTIEDLKESGDVENMAEHILLGWRKLRAGSGIVQRLFSLPKNKDGPVMAEWRTLDFNETTASFTGKSGDERPEIVSQFDDWAGR